MAIKLSQYEPFSKDNGILSGFLEMDTLPLPHILEAHPQFESVLSIYEPLHTAAIFGGLLTVPELQCNCCRLEVLSHFAVAFGNGRKKPSKSAVAAWFAEMSSGPCGRYEDPAEDSFISVVTSRRGNFRVFEGIWESAGFFLQRVVNVAEDMPDKGEFIAVKEAMYALLQLSDLVCERAGLSRYALGTPNPESHLSNAVRSELQRFRQRVTFSDADLQAGNVPMDKLTPFILDAGARPSIKQSSLSKSPLLYQPLLRGNGILIVALPTAISVAIRMMVIGKMHRAGYQKSLLTAIGEEYREYFAATPPLRSARNAPFHWMSRGNNVIASFAQEVDHGRFLHLIYLLDTLKDFLETGPVGLNPSENVLSDEIKECQAALSGKPTYLAGLTLIISCGVGRAERVDFSGTTRPDWRVTYLNAADASILTLAESVTPLALWRILDAQRRLSELGVELFNINGLLGLIAWVDSLSGHIVQHAQIPEGFGQGGPSRLLLAPNIVYDLRTKTARQVDLHSIQTITGDWRLVQRIKESLFREDWSLPLYALRDITSGNIPIVFVTPTRAWWCEITHPMDYNRWKIMQTWVPRIAAVLDHQLVNLPVGPLLLQVNFAGYSEEPSSGNVTTCEEIQNRISVSVNLERHTVSIQTDTAFENGLTCPTNIAEAALVGAIVNGVVRLAGQPDDAIVAHYRDEITRDQHARSSHGIRARHFRDYVRESLRENPITIDEVDDATLRLGLGWRVRKREDGPSIDGKSECTAFLNALVVSLEDDLCNDLRDYDRQRLIERSLCNHETLMADQASWQRTSAAMLALHNDHADVREVILEHGFKTNAALLASRVLVELAVCECRLAGGRIPGELDLSRLMAKLMLIMTFGGWSDAIHLEAMSPCIEVKPLGDIHVDPSFDEEIIVPFGRLSSSERMKISIDRYPTNFEEPVTISAVEDLLEPDFIVAWRDEYGFSLDDMRRVIDEVEDIGIKENKAVFAINRSRLYEIIDACVPGGRNIIDALTTIPREEWRAPLAGPFNEKDRYPWRFRRRLSLLRRPIVQIENSDDPTLILTPGLARDAIAYTVRGYHEGSFPPFQLSTPAMKSWCGKAADRRGKQFTVEVATRMEELGWKTEREVPVTKILRKGFDVNYGDVDVLAWSHKSNRVLFIECKDVHFHKSPGEIAEQLRDFRGKTRDGKRDLLRKHLDRCEILREHAGQVAIYVKCTATPSIESWVVFKNPVPMLFAWKELKDKVQITTFDSLDQV